MVLTQLRRIIIVGFLDGIDVVCPGPREWALKDNKENITNVSSKLHCIRIEEISLFHHKR